MDVEGIKPPVSFSKKIVKNTIYNIIGNFSLIAIGFILVPYIIKHIGVETYGNVWVIAIIIISFSQLFDFGLGSACTKYIAEYHTTSDTNNLNKILNSSFFFFLIFWLVFFPIIIIFKENIVSLFGTSPDFKEDMYFVLLLSTAIVAVNHISSPFYAGINAIQRYDILNISIIFASILNLIFIILFFNFGFGVKGVAISYFLLYFFIAISVIFNSFKLIPGIKINYKLFNFQTLKNIFSFGLNLQLSRVAQIAVFQFDKLLSLKFFGGNYAAYYDIGSKITGFTRSIPLLLVSAVVPAASEMDAKGESFKLKSLFETGTRYLIIVGLLISGFVFTEANLIIQAWVGKKLSIEGISTSASIVRLIALGYFINMITGAMSSTALGFGRTDLERRAGILMLITFPIFCMLLIPLIGFYGIAISVTCSLVLSATYYTWQFIRVIDYKFEDIIRMLIKPVLSTIISSTITLIISNLIPEYFYDSRIGGIITVIILFIVYSIIYLSTIIALKTYSNTDIIILKMFIDRLRNFKKTNQL